MIEAVGAIIGVVIAPMLLALIDRIPARMALVWKQEAAEVFEVIALPAKASPRRQSVLWNACITILSSILTAAVMTRGGTAVECVTGVILTWGLLLLAGIDYRTALLPDRITQPILWIGLLLSVTNTFIPASSAVMGVAAGYGLLVLIQLGSWLLTGEEGIGQGDVKLLAALGAWMGPYLMPFVLGMALTLHLGVKIASRRTIHAQMAFGPCLALAGWTCFVAGPRLARFLHMPSAIFAGAGFR